MVKAWKETVVILPDISKRRKASNLAEKVIYVIHASYPINRESDSRRKMAQSAEIGVVKSFERGYIVK